MKQVCFAGDIVTKQIQCVHRSPILYYVETWAILSAGSQKQGILASTKNQQNFHDKNIQL